MANFRSTIGFHDEAVASQWKAVATGHWDTQFTYTFRNFFHPFVGELIARLNRKSLPGVLDAGWQDSLKQDFFKALYTTTENSLVRVNYSPKEIDVEEHGPYANYNWEL